MAAREALSQKDLDDANGTHMQSAAAVARAKADLENGDAELVVLLDALKRGLGAGQAAVLGSPDQATLVWMNPDRMASLGITTSDVIVEGT